MNLDRTKPYGMVIGHRVASFEQNGKLFRGDGSLIEEEITPRKLEDAQIPTDDLEGAKSFLRNILKEQPLSKATVFKIAEQNNQNWDDVRNAAMALGIQKIRQGSTEAWKLGEK